MNVLGWALAAAWALALFLQSGSPTAGGFLANFPEGADKVAHAAAYGLLGAFLTLATGRVWLATLIALAFGVTDEIHQYFVPERFAEVLDVVADGSGALLGASLVAFLSRLRRRRR